MRTMMRRMARTARYDVRCTRACVCATVRRDVASWVVVWREGMKALQFVLWFTRPLSHMHACTHITLLATQGKKGGVGADNVRTLRHMMAFTWRDLGDTEGCSFRVGDSMLEEANVWVALAQVRYSMQHTVQTSLHCSS